jgi:hypothetical protein
MDTIFSAYDKWHGLIPLIGGIYGLCSRAVICRASQRIQQNSSYGERNLGR